ncbi:MAG: hypothetical protein K6E77_12730 [Lachnospiraceae bacterium]|nr:hypothetical protein [Lachnospiraceae bacterium]
MKYSVDLQPAMMDELYWFFLWLGVLVAIVMLVLVYRSLHAKVLELRIAKMNALKKKLPVIPGAYRMMFLKDAAYARLNLLERSQSEGKITIRDTCIGISAVIREFLAKAAGRNADCQTLLEIRQWNRPEVVMFIDGIYDAEFSRMSVKDTERLFREARKLVLSWK